MSEGLKILYVDDEADIRTIVEISLGLDPGLEVRTADSAIDALEVIGADWMPDIALVDMMMPGMSGIDLLQAMRARADTAHIPIIFCTASARSTEVKHYTDAGAMGVISKPFDPITLASLVREQYARRPGG